LFWVLRVVQKNAVSHSATRQGLSAPDVLTRPERALQQRVNVVILWSGARGSLSQARALLKRCFKLGLNLLPTAVDDGFYDADPEPTQSFFRTIIYAVEQREE
jgi:hypothetical protein